METKMLWELFMETGAPEAYLLYQRALKMEAGHVSDNEGTGPAGNGLQ